MYLLLVDYSVISSADLQEMIEQSPSGTDIVNCFSADTLLKVADRISPDIIIIDFDLVSDDLHQLFSSLRAKSKGAHILALINPENYERLFAAIELGGVDDYIVKPIRKEDFFARVQIAAKKPKLQGKGFYKPEQIELDLGDLPPLEVEALGAELGDAADFDLFSDRKEHGESPEAISKELEAANDTGIDQKEAGLFGQFYRNPYEEEHSELEASTEDIAGEPFESAAGFIEDNKFEQPIAEFKAADEYEKIEAVHNDAESASKELDSYDFEEYSFDDVIPGGEEKIALENEEPGAVQYEEPISDSFGAFDDPFKTVDDSEQVSEFTTETVAEPEPALFEESAFEEPEKSLYETADDSVSGLFEEPVDSSIKSFEEILADPPEVDDKWDFPGPVVIKPAADFLEEPETPNEKAKPSFPSAAPREDSDEQYFDELFDEKPKPKPERFEQESPRDENDAQPTEIKENVFPETSFEPFFGETIATGVSAIAAELPVSRKELSHQSSLPGESADDFLFGSGELTDTGYNHSGISELIDDEDDAPRTKRKSKKSGSGFGKAASVVGNVFFVLLLLFMATLSFFLIQSRIAGGVPKVAGYQMYIVLSGSMNPEFDTGSIAFVKETLPEQLVVGDIITFRSQSGSDSLTTHRIVEVVREDGLRFVTRGDANNVNDPNPVLAENVVGMVTGSVPYVGYVLNFVQTRQGLILLIFVPGVLIILFELGKIMKYLTQDEGGSRKSKKRKKYPDLAEE